MVGPVVSLLVVVVLVLLAGFNVLSAFIQRPILRQVIRSVKEGTPEATQLNHVLHQLWPVLYGCCVGLAVVATWRGLVPALLLGVAAAGLRAGIFDPALHHGLPGRWWWSFGESAWYDRRRRALAARWGWSVERMGSWSIRAAWLATGLVIGLLEVSSLSAPAGR